MDGLATHAPTLQVFGHLASGTVEPRLDGSDRAADGLADLLVRQALLVKQDENQAVLRTKASQRPLQFPGQIVRVGEAGAGVDAVLGSFSGDRPARPAAQRGATTVGGDPQQPGPQRTRAIETVNPT